MQKLDVIVLPQLRSRKYLGFPLRCIEAVSTGKIVVAARSKVYEDIFSGKYQPYWYSPGDSDSLYSSIKKAISDPLLSFRITQGLAFARDFSWLTRTTKFLEKLPNTF